MFHPPRSGTICVQPDKHWYSFKGNLGKTAERWDRVHIMDISECYDARLEITIPAGWALNTNN